MAYSRKLQVAPLAVALLATIVVLLVTPPPCAAQQSSLQDEIVNLHNKARADVGVKPVSWNETLAKYAESYAAKRQGDCKLKPSGGPYGENLFSGAADAAADVVAAWVSQKQYYDHGSNTCAAGKKCGEYTQVVWRSTTNVGCAYVECSNNGGGVFAICSYNPPGNLDGKSPY